MEEIRLREALGEMIVELRKEWRQEIGELRAEIEILRGVVKSNNVEQLVRKTKTNAG
ncbi:MAG: hypothetical protein WCC54_19145 [Pseudolabrys sp.]